MTDPVTTAPGTAPTNTVTNTVAIDRCKLPPFWRTNPELWFLQVESVFSINRISMDSTKYNHVVSSLDPDTVTEVADILRAPPETDKYEALKTACLRRLMDSADRQLHRALTGLELSDRKPSQLLRQMQLLAGDRASEDVIRVKWLDLLPPTCRRFLKVFKASSLEELAAAADEMIDINPVVATTSSDVNPDVAAFTPRTPAARYDPVAAELAALRTAMSDLAVSIKSLINSSRPPRRERSRTPVRPQGSSTSSNSTARCCWYHNKYGADANFCREPCSFSKNSTTVNATHSEN